MAQSEYKSGAVWVAVICLPTNKELQQQSKDTETASEAGTDSDVSSTDAADETECTI
jgi:hypothetical protein